MTSLWRKLVSFLVLPPEISDFERRYLAQTNRVAVAFFCVHLPVMMVIAAVRGTGVIAATMLTSAVIAGPLLALRAVESPRWQARVIAFAAMGMGGVLVHVGQGPMQIEMHFYFFVLIALLTVFGDPLVIIVAALTVASHHVALYLCIPASVFNYEASLWTVAIHALFVIVESIGACYVARRFFDNVIGLERIVAARTAELAWRNERRRVVHDAAELGLLTADLDGNLDSDRSRILDDWFDSASVATTAWEYLGQNDASAAMWLETTFDMIRDGVLAPELAIAQLPKQIRAGQRTLQLKTRLTNTGKAPCILFMLTDMTSEVERQRLESEQHDLVALAAHAVRDPRSVEDFMAECGRMMKTIDAGGASAELLRLLHTLKGNCATFGATTVSRLCHELEERIADRGSMLADERDALARAWFNLVEQTAALRGGTRPVLDVDREEHADVVRRLRAGTASADLADQIEGWACDRASVRLTRLAAQARLIADRLGRAGLRVTVDHGNVRLPDIVLCPLWSAMGHLVRNAVDHGIESPEERVAKGKDPAGHLRLATRTTGDALVIELDDDGRGIDWTAVAARAGQRSLPASSREDLVNALCATGFTTRTEVTDVSGRGVGMAAVREECDRLGATLTISDIPGGGARVEIRVPISRGDAYAPLAAE